MNNIPARVTRHYAETRGYTVDTHCYPWFAYKGERFQPTRKFEVYTDIEGEFLADKGTAAVAVLKKNVSFFVDEMYPVQEELEKGGNVGPKFLAVRAHLEETLNHCDQLENFKVFDWVYDSDDEGKARLKVNLGRQVESDNLELLSEITLSLTADKASLEVTLYREEGLGVGQFDNTTQFKLEPKLDFLPFDGLMYITASEANKQLEYASTKS